MTKRKPTWSDKWTEKIARRCGHCNRRLPRRRPGQRGRPPTYCCRAHRQLAYEVRRAGKKHPLTIALLRRDIDALSTKAGIERAVVDVLRKLGFLEPAPKKPPHLRLVHDDGSEKPDLSADWSGASATSGCGQFVCCALYEEWRRSQASRRTHR